MTITINKSEFYHQEHYISPLLSEVYIQTRMINAADLKIGPDYSTPVISNAQKFVIPVPAFGAKGELLIYPKRHPKAGQPIIDYQGKPIGCRGIVFFNNKDHSWQAALGNGRSVIIINEVTQQQAGKLYQRMRDIDPNPNKLSLVQLKQVLAYAQQELSLKDMYNSTRSFILKNMTSVGSNEKFLKGDDIAYGLKKRDDRDINQAIYIPGAFQFKGPAASPQMFSDGGVIVEQDGKMRGIQPDIFMRTYTLANGDTIKLVNKDIKSQMIK